MNNERITLTMKEQKMNDILVKLISGEIKTNDAMRLTGLSERQTYRKKKEYALFHIKIEIDLLEEDIQMS